MCATYDTFLQCLCVSFWIKCGVWPSSLIADRGHPLGVTTLAWLHSNSRAVCTVSCQAFAYIQSSVVACQTKWWGICIVVSLLVPFTRPVPLPSHISTSQHLDHFELCLKLISHLSLAWHELMSSVINEMAVSVLMLKRWFVSLKLYHCIYLCFSIPTYSYYKSHNDQLLWYIMNVSRFKLFNCN